MIEYEQAVVRRGGPADESAVTAITDHLISAIGDNAQATAVGRAARAALDRYVIIPREDLPNPHLDDQERWHVSAPSETGRLTVEMTSSSGDAEHHRACARGHLALAGALTDYYTLGEWKHLYAQRNTWASTLLAGRDYSELEPETQDAIDRLINAGVEQ